ncbi:MAG: LamG domain-containing protein [Phycisphaeraceae bacterium]|nr:LamG domain-containing protein [Phycisphaeraceae bacterium]
MKKNFLLVLTTAVVFSIGLPLFGAEPEKQLLGFWRFDEGTGDKLQDVSGNNRAAQISHKMRGVKWVDGRSGKAIEFMGGDPAKRNVAGCVEILKGGKFDFSKGLTLECWINFTKIDRQQTYEIISNTHGDRGRGFRFILSWLKLGLMSGEGAKSKLRGANSSPSVIKFKKAIWYHIVGTYDGKNFRVYIDGKLVAETAGEHVLTTGRNSISIGSFKQGYAYGLNAIVDDVKVYNYARSAVEIVSDAKLGE